MDFRPDPALDDFRQTVHVFLGEKLPADLVQQTIAIFSSRDAMRRWQAILNDQGWGAPSWGTAHGGTGWSVEEQLIFEEECTRAGAPTLDGFGHKLLGPVLNHFATPEQWEAHVPHILRGERN